MNLVNEKERRVFAALQKLQTATVQELATETLINRTALYHTLDLLKKKGLVTEVKRNYTTVFQALSPIDFDIWSKTKLLALQKELNEIKTTIVKQQPSKPNLYSQIRYYEGVNAVKNLYYNTLRDNDEKEILAITDYSKAYGTLNDFFEEEYFPDRVQKGINVKSLLSKSPLGKRDVARQKELLREMRFNDVFKDFGIEINIVHNKVIIVAFDEQKPMGIMIKNPTISEAFRRIFSFIWEKS
jgi:sugar-specific transcriptional regulator TrmB